MSSKVYSVLLHFDEHVIIHFHPMALCSGSRYNDARTYLADMAIAVPLLNVVRLIM